jgi:hypothetical protein
MGSADRLRGSGGRYGDTHRAGSHRKPNADAYAPHFSDDSTHEPTAFYNHPDGQVSSRYRAPDLSLGKGHPGGWHAAARLR